MLCKQEGLAPLKLLKWVRTRWGSMFDLIERVIENREVRELPDVFRDAHCELLVKY